MNHNVCSVRDAGLFHNAPSPLQKRTALLKSINRDCVNECFLSLVSDGLLVASQMRSDFSGAISKQLNSLGVSSQCVHFLGCLICAQAYIHSS